MEKIHNFWNRQCRYHHNTHAYTINQRTTRNNFEWCSSTIDQTWYELTHHPIEVKEPLSLQPRAKITWKYENPENLATSGIYSDKDLAYKHLGH